MAQPSLKHISRLSQMLPRAWGTKSWYLKKKEGYPMDILVIIIVVAFVVYLAEKLFACTVEEYTYMLYTYDDEDEKDVTPEEWWIITAPRKTELPALSLSG